MEQFDRIEPETETQRTDKALRDLVPGASLPFHHGHVTVRVAPAARRTAGGQRLVTMLVHLLARMKGIVRVVSVDYEMSEPILPGVPLVGTNLAKGLHALVARISGPLSDYKVDLVIGVGSSLADASVSIGIDDADVVVGSDGWRALTGRRAELARWSDIAPFGPYMAATMGAAEVLKVLLEKNFGWREGTRASDTIFSLANFGVNDSAATCPDFSELDATGLSVAGAGAGGTATLYTLASIPGLTGNIVVVEPGRLKLSSLGRYLMSTYDQAHQETHKLVSVDAFMRQHAPRVTVEAFHASWREVQRGWEVVVCTVDTPEARRDVQQSRPNHILEAGVGGMLYAILRAVPGGWCLECKFPPDPEITIKRRSRLWGVPIEEVLRLQSTEQVVTKEDIDRMAAIQGKRAEELAGLLNVPFSRLPSLTECGETPLSLRVPSQAPVLPIATTAAGIVLAAEVAKDCLGVGTPLLNTFDHDLRYKPRTDRQRFRPRWKGCLTCEPVVR